MQWGFITPRWLRLRPSWLAKNSDCVVIPPLFFQLWIEQLLVLRDISLVKKVFLHADFFTIKSSLLFNFWVMKTRILGGDNDLSRWKWKGCLRCLGLQLCTSVLTWRVRRQSSIVNRGEVEWWESNGDWTFGRCGSNSRTTEEWMRRSAEREQTIIAVSDKKNGTLAEPSWKIGRTGPTLPNFLCAKVSFRMQSH